MYYIHVPRKRYAGEGGQRRGEPPWVEEGKEASGVLESGATLNIKQ